MPLFLAAILNPRMLIVFLMGFSSGLPLLLVGGTLKAWMTKEGMDLTVIGLFSLVGIPYTLKFIWAPLLDRFVLAYFGRRRGWMFVSQMGLIISLGMLGSRSPVESFTWTAIWAFLVAFFSASQDIVVDAYRREILEDRQLGLGSSLAITGYRMALLYSGAFALSLADQFPWPLVYGVMAATLLVGVFTTLFSPEPQVDVAPPKTFREAILEPFKEYFSRKGALTILAFILLYKIGDQFVSEMTNPFLIQLGFTLTQIGAVAKIVAFWASLAGGLTGGILIVKWGIPRSLWVFGVFQALTNFGFSILSKIGPSIPGLATVMTFEQLASGMATSAYVAYMASITNKKFTATQYALLSSLIGVPRSFAAAGTGWLAKTFGWTEYFIICTIFAVPGLLLLHKIAPWSARDREI